MVSVRELLLPPSAVPRIRTWRRSLAEPDDATLGKVNVFKPGPAWAAEVARIVGAAQPEATLNSCAL
jgi:hypothetical protein